MTANEMVKMMGLRFPKEKTIPRRESQTLTTGDVITGALVSPLAWIINRRMKLAKAE